MRLSLVLGSGGARGWAHIGVIEEVERRGHTIVSIAGASMGALVGGVYGTGKLPEVAQWAASLTRTDVVRLVDPALGSAGIVRGQKVLKKIEEIAGSARIEELSIPFTAVATDLLSQREIWFQSGPLYPAIRASISIPTIFTPVLMGDRLLADGGLVNPVPVEPTLAQVSDATIAVNLYGHPDAHPRDRLRKAIEAERQGSALAKSINKGVTALTDNELFHKITRYFEEPQKEECGQITEPGNPEAGNDPQENWGPEKLPSGISTWQVADMSMTTMQELVYRYRAASNPVSATIEIPIDKVGTLEFYRAQEMMDYGRELAAGVLDELES